MKTITTLLMIAALSQTALSQRQKQRAPVENKAVTPCNLTLDDAPKLRGFYLGQTADEIGEKVLGFMDSYLASDPLSYTERGIDFKIVHLTSLSNYSQVVEGNKDYEDINITWQFHNGKLARLFVNYLEYLPGSIHNFLKQVAETTGLPAASFKITGKHMASIRCNGFTVDLQEGEDSRAGWSPTPSKVVIEDTNSILQFEKTYKDYDRQKKADELRRRKEESDKKKIFKP